MAVLAGTLMVGALARAQQAEAEKAPGQKSPWIHVQVDDGSADRSKVDINLPLALVQVALEAVQDETISGGRVRLHHCNLKVDDLKRMWSELRKAGDAEFVRAEERDQTVKISQRGGQVLIEVRDRSGAQKVHVQVPATVVDALFSSEGDNLNLTAALSRLSASDRGELIKIDDGENHVRVWID
jgi:hypothetical protein